MGVGSLHVFYSLNLNDGQVAELSAFGDVKDMLPKLSIFRHVSHEIPALNLRNLFIIVMPRLHIKV